MPIPIVIAIVLAISAGVMSFIGGRRMLRHVDDALYADRMFSHRVTMIRIHAVVILAIFAISPDASWWTVPLAFLSIATNGFPARRRLFDESWNFAAYLTNRIRM